MYVSAVPHRSSTVFISKPNLSFCNSTTIPFSPQKLMPICFSSLFRRITQIVVEHRKHKTGKEEKIHRASV